MRKAVLISIGVLLVFGVALIWGIRYFENYFGAPFATYVATSGEVGDLRIGESKNEILAGLTHQSFAIDPKPKECPINWIEVGAMSDIYRSCLLRSDHWMEGSGSTSNLCKGHSDSFTKLTFNEDRLVSVVTECWHPQ